MVGVIQRLVPHICLATYDDIAMNLMELEIGHLV